MERRLERGIAALDGYVAAQVEVQSEVGVHGLLPFMLLVFEQCSRRIYLRGIGISLPPGFLRAERKARVLRGSRVEQLLLVVDILVALRAGKHSQVDGKQVAEGFLLQVYLGGEGLVLVHSHHGVVVHEAQRGAIVALLVAATEGYVVVLHESRARYAALEVGVFRSARHGGQPQTVGSGEIVGCLEHIECLEHALEAHVGVVGYLEFLVLTFLRSHNNHTAGTSRTEGCRLGSVLQDGEALDVGRIDAYEGGQVAVNSVDDYQRVVAAGQ